MALPLVGQYWDAYTLMKELTQYASLQDNDQCIEQNINYNYYQAMNITNNQSTPTISTTDTDTSNSGTTTLITLTISAGVIFWSLFF